MNAIFIIGRILLGGFFIMNAYGHLSKVKAMAGYAQSKKVPFPHLAVIITGVMLGIGGLSIVLNIQMMIGLWILVVFLIPVTVAMHPFWKEKDPMTKMSEQIAFMKNIAILGALLIMASLGIF